MKKTIRMNERELHNMVSESVKRVLNEISNSLAKATHDNISDMGQYGRADQLNNTFRSVNNDEYAEYDLNANTLHLYDGAGNSLGCYGRDKDGNLRRFRPDRNWEVVNGDYDDFKKCHRVRDPRVAQILANHMNNFMGTPGRFTKNHFRF